MKRYIKKDFCPIVSIGIPVYNEAENIKELAESILAQKNINLREVIFIVSGCTDDSAAVVKGFVEKDARFKLYKEQNRNGKAVAVNLFLKSARGNICVLLSSDIILDENCLSALIEPFKDQRIGMTGARIIPVRNDSNFMCSLNKIIWEIHNQLNIKKPKLGEAVAFRDVIDEIPGNTAVDEASIEAFFTARDYKLYYARKALVYNKCPITVKDLFIQRVRIFWGHLDIKTRLGYAVGSMDLKLVAEVTFIYMIKNLHLFIFIFFLYILEALSRLVAYCEYYFYKELPPFIWPKYRKR